MTMRTFTAIVLVLGAAACAAADEVPDDVKALLGQLTQAQQPTLSDFESFYGPNAEDETQMLLYECEGKGLAQSDCVKQSNEEARSADEHPSRYFAWIRRCYGTPNAKWAVQKLEDVRDKSGTIVGTVYEATINSNRFKIHRADPSHRYDGLRAAIFKINGVSTKELMPRRAGACAAPKQ